ncbi:MAG: hydrogenase [bacterium]|nr:hydrogenase [bacterium]
MVNLDDIKSEAKRVLEEGRVKYVIGYSNGTAGLSSTPVFITTPDDVEKLTWNPTCYHNLIRFILDEKKEKDQKAEPDAKPVAIIAKGCDSRAAVVLLQEHFIERDDIYILGISCEGSGVVDERKLNKKLKNKKADKVEFGENDSFTVTSRDKEIKVLAREVLADKCLECKVNYPIIFDKVFGDKIARKTGGTLPLEVEVEPLKPDKKWAFWENQFSKCIRCYACRSICPMCYCDECVVDSVNFAVTPDTTAEEKAQKIKWIERSSDKAENIFFHLTRAIHLAGRCVDCDECSRACPVDIPLRLLNKKIEDDAKRLFDYEVGLDPDEPPLISSFRDEDPGDFIR